MANKFAAVARKETTLSPLMEGREKMDTDDIIKQYPQGFTVTGFDFIGTGEDAYPVFIFAENPQKFVFGGTVFGNIARSWVDMYSGDVEEASKELGLSGGVKMVFTKSRTKNGNNVTTITVLD